MDALCFLPDLGVTVEGSDNTQPAGVLRHECDCRFSFMMALFTFQIASRFEQLELPVWTESQELRRFIAGYLALSPHQALICSNRQEVR